MPTRYEHPSQGTDREYPRFVQEAHGRWPTCHNDHVNLLLVEDDKAIAETLVEGLTAAGHTVVHVTTGAEALAQRGQELVLLDLGLPDMDGRDVCRELRRRSTTPIIMLTARSEEFDRVLGLELGADDYITKPFLIREFRSRVRAVLRRAATPHLGGKREETIDRGEVRIDLPRRTVEVRGKLVQLTFVEFELLALLAANPGVVYSRRQLLERLRGGADYREPRTIDVHVRHLREKIEVESREPELILTVRGAGYRFRDG